jgi:hypothetical protein
MQHLAVCTLLAFATVGLLWAGIPEDAGINPAAPIRRDNAQPGAGAQIQAVKVAIAADVAAGHVEFFEGVSLMARFHDPVIDGPGLCYVYRCESFDEAMCRFTVDAAVRSLGGVPAVYRPGPDPRESESADAS